MALQQSSNDLVKKFDDLLYVVSQLFVMLAPNPMRDEPHLRNQLWDLMVPLEAATEQALKAARVAAGAAGYPLDIDQLRQGLVDAQREYNVISKIYLFELVFNPELAGLIQTGRRGDPWRQWALAVAASIAGCGQPLYDVSEALFQCWQEIVDRIGMNSVTVQTKAVGQEISVPAAELRKVVERVG